MQTLEEAGVWLLALPIEASKDCDGFSFWVDQTPIIAFAANSSMDRIRFTILHELGHLVMHDVYEDQGTFETEANLFAGEFLIPSEVIKQEIKPPFAPMRLSSLKVNYGVSLLALAHRAKEVGIIDKKELNIIYGKFISNKWKIKEPFSDHLNIEKPRLLRQLFEEKFKLMEKSNPCLQIDVTRTK